MKILVTGVNNGSAKRNYYKSHRNRSKLITPATGLVMALEGMGHDVDQRYVTPGEDLSGYDKVFSFNTFRREGQWSGLYGVLWVQATRKDAIICIDDWAVAKPAYKLHTSDHEDLDHLLFRDWVHTAAPQEHKDALTPEVREKLKSVVSSKSLFDDFTFLYCAFNKFDVSKILDVPHKAYFYNPDSVVPTPLERLGFQLVKPERKKSWAIIGLAGTPLNKITKDVTEFKCPIVYHGPSSKCGTFKEDIVSEPEVLATYQRTTMVYYSDQGNFGSNWWRNRPRQCADLGAVLYIPSDEEAKLFGESYRHLSIELLESMSVEELAELAAKQKKDLYESNPIDKEMVYHSLEQVLNL